MQRDVIQGYRLSPQQERLWLLYQADRSAAYHAFCAVLIDGVLDASILKQSIQEIAARCEILHTTFQFLSGMNLPVQVVNDACDLSVGEIDLTGSDDQAQAANQLIEEFVEAGFDFGRGPLVHASLLKLSDRRHQLLLNLPAMCADGVTLRNLVLEIAQCYEALLENREFSGEPLQYAVISEWLNDLIESDESEAGKEYWRAHHNNDRATPPIPFEKKLSEGSPFEPKFVAASLEGDLTAKLESTACGRGVTLSTFLLTCWSALLARLTGETNLVVGVGCHGRTDEEIESALGPLTKYVPIEADFDRNAAFAEALKEIGASIDEAIKWQEVFSFARREDAAAETEEPEFFPIAFDYQEPTPAYTAGGAAFTLSTLSYCLDRFKLRLACVELNETLALQFHYDSALFDRCDVERIAESFSSLLRSSAASPEREIGDLEIIGEAERRRLLVDFNNTDADYRNHQCLHERFEEQAGRSPDSVAAIIEDRQLSFGELSSRANNLASRLNSLGIGPEDIVAVRVDRSLEMVIGLLGALKAGAAYVPIDPSYPKERTAFILKDSRARALLIAAGARDEFSARDIETVVIDHFDPAETAAPFGHTRPSVTPDNPAYLIYTSGTTGTPRGVVIAHRSICNRLLWMQNEFPVDGNDRLLQKTSISFDASVWEIFLPLMTGACLVLAAPDEQRDSQKLIERVIQHEITVLQLVPSMFRILLQERDLDKVKSLKRMFCGGEALTADLRSRSFERLPDTELINLYGPTETSIDATFRRCGPSISGSTVPIGNPIGNMRIHLLDARGRLVPKGVPGELYIGGTGLARGYLNTPQSTAEKFMPDPLGCNPGARLYRSGDLAKHLNDGGVEYLGRADSQVKIRGFRIEPGEIESLLSTHPLVGKAAVVIKDDEQTGPRLAAYIMPAAPVMIEESASEARPAEELRAFLETELPEYMVPSAIVVLDSLPTLPSGKIDRRALAMLDDPGSERFEGRATLRTPVEELLASIWSQVLGVEKVGPDDSFLGLGGHSLMATQVISRMREAFQLDLPLRIIFETANLSELARRIEGKLKEGLGLQEPPFLPVPRSRNLPLSFAQQRLWYFDKFEPNTSLFNISTTVKVTGLLDLEALEKCFNEITRRHEVLRTRFAAEDGTPRQVISPPAYWKLPITDLRDLPESEREPRARQHIFEESQTHFDLANGGVFRARLLRLTGTESILIIAMHHIASDAWSLGVFIREISALYKAFTRNEPSPLPDLPIQYADFAVWQREWLQGEVMESHLSYWKEHLAGAPPFLDLPTDRPRPRAQSFRGACYPVVFSKELTSQLKALGAREGATLFMTLLTAFQIMLYFYTGHEDIVVGADVANRNRPEIEGLIGFFINQLVLRIKLSANQTFRQVLARVREISLGAYAHQDLPFEKLVSTLSPERSLKYAALFQVKFVLQNVPRVDIEIPGLTLTVLPDDLTISKLDLTCWLSEKPTGIDGVFEYNSDLFEVRTIERMTNHLESILREAVARPDLKVDDFKMLLRQNDIQQQLAEKEKADRANLAMLKRVKPRTVSLQQEGFN